MTASADTLELFNDCRSDLGEGPWWDETSHHLMWLDLFEGKIHTLDLSGACEAGAVRTIVTGQHIGVFALRERGGLLVAAQDGLGTADFARDGFELRVPINATEPDMRSNDGACDALGRLWFGTMAYDQTPGRGTVYRVDPDFSVTPILHGVTTSNGMGWSPDGRRFYHADTGTGEIKVYDFDLAQGTIGNGRVIYTAPPSAGSPDGLTVDAEGDLWVAMWGGDAVLRLGDDGVLKETLAIPATYVTSVTFGGADLRDLFITTARRPLSAAQLTAQPHAGSIFRCRPGVAGQRQYRFAG